jgi:hypothetical protein
VLVKLAVRVARQLELRDPADLEAEQLRGQRVAWLIPGGGLHDGL